MTSRRRSVASRVGRILRDGAPQLAWLSSSKAEDIQWDPAASADGGDFTSRASWRNRRDFPSLNKEEKEDVVINKGEAVADSWKQWGNEEEGDEEENGGEPAKKNSVRPGSDSSSTDEEKALEMSALDSSGAENLVENVDGGKDEDDQLKEAPSHGGGYDLGISMGEHLTSTNVFTMETLSKRTVTIIMVAYYTIFLLLIAASFVSYKETHSYGQFAVISAAGGVGGSTGTGNEKLCYPQADETCVSDSVVTVHEANLLANTVVVSSGINVSDWVGEEAKPGTPPFMAHNISDGAFLVDDQLLEYDANPDLHHIWSKIRGAFWMGHNGGQRKNTLAQSYEIDLRFVRLDGTPWPADTASYDFPLTVHGYACLRGGDCNSVGYFRSQFLQSNADQFFLKPAQYLSGNQYSALIVIPGADVLLEDVVESIGWRIVASADPGGAVSDCAAGRNCAVFAELTGMSSLKITRVVIDLLVLVTFMPYFFWWVYTTAKRLGRDPRGWHVENQWVLILGIGFFMSNGVIYVSVQVDVLTDNFDFNEKLWAASFLIMMFGQNMQNFALACFTDAPRRYVVSRFSFYIWKILFCVVTYTAMFVTIMYHFPDASGRDQPGTDSSIGGLGFVTAPVTWPRNDKIVLTTFQIIWLLCIVYGIFYYFRRGHKTKMVLEDLPYNMTRPVQLSFRFFRWAAMLWIIDEIISLCVSIAVGSNRSSDFNTVAHLDGLDSLVVALNQIVSFFFHRNPLKTLYEYMFILVYMVFFLPPPSNTKISKTHHVTEKDARGKTKEESLTGHFLLVLDRARLLCTCSRETYLPFDDEERRAFAGVSQEELEKLRSPSLSCPNAVSELPINDIPGESTENTAAPIELGVPRVDSWLPSVTFSKKGDPDPIVFARKAGESVCSGGPAPPGSTWAMGCRVIRHIAEPDYADMHNSRAMLFRHVESNDLIIAFRGTKTGKQIKTDLMTQRVYVSLDSFLTISSAGEGARKTLEGLVPEQIEEMMRDGTYGRVSLLDLLHKDNQKEMPEFLKGQARAEDGIRGQCFLHFGFWSSYSRLRIQVHKAVYEELVSNLGRLLVCGHSLGGAQATACAYDMSRWIIPSAKKALLLQQGREAAEQISMCLYTYGSPRLGGRNFQEAFDKAVPECERIICDGDIVTTTPPEWLGFRHVGDEYVFDYTGTCACNPSFIERKFAHKTRTNADAHRLPNYTRAIKRAYHPSIPTEQLLGLLRDAYGKKIPGEGQKNMWENADSTLGKCAFEGSSGDPMTVLAEEEVKGPGMSVAT